MKVTRSRITANQFDTVLVEEVEHRRGMNIPANALSSAVTFCDLLSIRLFGPREMSKRSPEYQAMFERVIAAARQEREQYQQQQREQERAERDRREQERARIIVPGQSRN